MIRPQVYSTYVWSLLKPSNLPFPYYPSRFSQSPHLNSLSQTENSYSLSILHMVVYVSMLLSRQSPPSPPLHQMVNLTLSSLSVSPSLPCKYFHQYPLSRFHIYALVYNFFFWLTSLCVVGLSPSTSLELTQCIPFCGWIIFQCIVPHYCTTVSLSIHLSMDI